MRDNVQIGGLYKIKEGKSLCTEEILSPYVRFLDYAINPLKEDYSTIEATTPDATVLPPSLIANLNPSSIAIEFINSTVIVTLSPGITISIPSGNLQAPVTSVVLK